jgi:hypothetical protein
MKPQFVEAVMLGLGNRSMPAVDLSRRIGVSIEETYMALIHLEGQGRVRVVCDFALDEMCKAPSRRWESMEHAFSKEEA